MEIVAFEIDGTRHGLELRHARIFSEKLREFARGEHEADLVEINRRTGLDAAQWLDGAEPLADRIDRWVAEDRTDAIALDDGAQARAAYAVLSITWSDGWDAREVSELWAASRNLLGLDLAPPILGGSTDRRSRDQRAAWHSAVRNAFHRLRWR